MRNAFIFAISCIAVFTSCKKYVDIVPKGKLIPQELRDYRLLLNNSPLLLASYGTQEYLTDDLDFSTDPKSESMLGFTYTNLFTFQPEIYLQNTDDPEWNKMYSQIYIANVVINEVMKSTNGTQLEKEHLLGEALVLRSHNYWALVNIYAKAYNAQSAATDPGVPLVLKPDLQADLTRKPIADVYAQILGDLEQATRLLPVSSNNNYQPSKAAAFAMLCRTRMMMRDYPNAEKMADSVLKYRNTLFDLNTIVSNPTNLPQYFFHPEVVYLREASNHLDIQMLSAELLGLLDTKDLRRVIFTADAKTVLNSSGVVYNGEFLDFRARNTGPTVPEMMLVKAECLARKGDFTNSIALLNKLRKNRIITADYQDISATSSTGALTLVLEERRREMFSVGARFFDLKRFTNEPALAKTITHVFNSQIYTLDPKSKIYVYPIPPRVLEIGPGIIPNER